MANGPSLTMTECSIFIPSCDSYSDLWDPFFHFFWKFWPDCPFPVYLGGNSLRREFPRVHRLYSNCGNVWTDRVHEQVRALPTPYVLLMLEDFFLRSPVNTAGLLACYHNWRKLDAHCLRLVRRPGPNRALPGQPHFGILNLDAPYRISTQAAIWKKETLLSLMRPGESIWQFEIEGTRRSRAFPDGFYGVWRNQLTYGHHVLERGKWFPKAVRWCRKMGVACDLARRPAMSLREISVWKCRKARSVLADCLPYPARRRMRQWLGKVSI